MKNIFTYLYTCTWEKCAIRRNIFNRGNGCPLWVVLLIALSGALFAISCADSPIDPGDFFTAPEPIGTLNASSSDASSVTLNWDPPNSSDAAQIEIRWTPEDGEAQPKIVPADSIGAIITGLNTGVEYTFSIAVVDEAGNTSNITKMNVATTIIFDSESYAFTGVAHSSGSTVGSVLAIFDSKNGAFLQYDIIPNTDADADTNTDADADANTDADADTNTDGDLFNINPGTGAITVGDNDLATETEYTFSVRAKSSKGGSGTVPVTVNTTSGAVIFSNAPYIFSNSKYNAQSEVGTVSAMVDSSSATISSYQIFNNNDGTPVDVLPNEDATFFAIDANGVITVGDIPLDTNTSYTFSVRATSSEDTSAVVVVTVMTVLAPISFNESVYAFSNIARAANTSVGTVVAMVDSGNADIASYEIVASSDGANFVIDTNSGAITVGNSAIAPNTTYTFMVRATSSEGTNAEVTVTASTALAAVTFPNTNAPYVFADGSHQSGSTVGIVSATVDSVTATIASYAIVSGVDDGALFAIDATSGIITVGGNALTPGDTYAFSVIATTSEGATATVRVMVSSVGLDTTAPNPVTDLVADTVAGTSNIALTWKNSSSADATFVRIDWMLSGLLTVIGTDTLPVSAPSVVQSTTITGLNSEIAYTFRVVVLDNAVDTAGDANPNTSAAESVSKTTLDTTPPKTVTGVGAVPISGSSSVLLTWTDSDSADATAGVHIEWRFDGVSEGNPLGSVSVAQGVEMATIAGLNSEQGYIFTLQAEDTAGNLSGPVPKSVTTLDADAPAAVKDFKAENTGTDGTQVLLRWTDSISADVAFVRIAWRLGTATTGAPINSERFVASGPTTRIISGLTSETEYTFTIIVEDNAVDVNGNPLPNDSAAVSASVTTPDVTAPDAVDDVFATPVAGSTDIKVKWTDSSSSDVTEVRITWVPTDGMDASDDDSVKPGEEKATISATRSKVEYTVTLVAVDAAGNESLSRSAMVTTADIHPPAAVTAVQATPLPSGTEVELTWVGSTSYDVTGDQTIRWSTSAAGAVGGSKNVDKNDTSTTISNLVFDTEYRFFIRVTDGENTTETSGITVHTEPNPVDADGDGLIDIDELIELHNMRYNLDGTSYKTSSTATGVLCGRDGSIACSGYELTAELNFDADGDGRTWNQTTLLLDLGDHNASYFGVTRTDAGGWGPIGDATTPFSTVFEGNGFAIRGLAVKRSEKYLGMFGRIDESAVIRNVRLIDSLVDYNGDNTTTDLIGTLVGHNRKGTIIASSASGVVDGSGGTAGVGDHIGGLVGENNGVIIASYAHSDAIGASRGDSVGGLVGYNHRLSDPVIKAVIIASYATGDVDGGMGFRDRSGGLVGRNTDIIIASYATGDVTDPDAGVHDDRVGGLVGAHSGTIINASYATGDVTGGENRGALLGSGSSNVTDSYGFGTTVRTGNGNNGTGAPKRFGRRGGPPIRSAAELFMENTPMDNWNAAGMKTLDAWDLGDRTQAPVLRYADYDGGLDDYGCGDESTAKIVIPSRVPFGDGLVDVVCGSTPLPEQPEQGDRCPTGFVHAGTACVPPASTWTERTSGTTNNLRNIAYGNGTWVVVGESGTTRTATDPTGTWTANNNVISNTGLAYGNGTWVATGFRSAIRTSTNPTGTWTARANSATRDLHGIAYADSTWVVVGSYDNGSGTIHTATDPTGTWTAHNGGLANLREVAYGGGTWVAVGGDPSFRPGATRNIFTATDPTDTWTARIETRDDAGLGAIAYYGGTWVAVGEEGTILTATDPTDTWTARTSGTSVYLIGVTYANGIWVAVGEEGTILTATDPTDTWTARTSGTDENLHDVTYANNTWIVVGDDGTILTAP